MQLKPLFRYVGGKARLIRNSYPTRPTNIKSYCEPFFGGGAMFCDLVNRGSLDADYTALINDLDTNLVNIYKFIKENSLETISTTIISLGISGPPTKKKYIKLLKKYNTSDRHPLIFLYLLRNSFSGMFRYNKDSTITMGIGHVLKTQWDFKQLEGWHKALQHCEITNETYRNIDYSNYEFIYCDPPYVDSTYNYQNQGVPNKSNEIVSEIINYFSKEFQGTVWLSNKYSGIEDYSGYQINKINNYYNLGRRECETVTEILLIN